MSSEFHKHGLLSFGAYLPAYALDRAEIPAAHGGRPGKGSRSVAFHDEDTTSMAVEAARGALWDGREIHGVHFATTAPAYFDKTNASAIHAALSLPADGFAVDMAGSIRGGAGAVRAAAAMGGLAVVSDVRVGRLASEDERDGGDGAAAFVFGTGEGVVAEVIAEASATAEFLDRWRTPGSQASGLWEERFGLTQYMPLIQDAVGRALAAAGLEPSGVDHVVISCPRPRAARAALKGFAPEAAAAHALTGEIGYLGAADAGVLLVDVLERARPSETILVVTAADGCDALVLRTTEQISRRPARASVRERLARRRRVAYLDYLAWRGIVEREPPRRPDLGRPAAPPSARAVRWKFGFVGTRCEACATVHMPPQRVCMKCGATDQMTEQPLADVQATVATFTLDRLAPSLAPPVVAAVVDFDGGGRYSCEMTDVEDGAVSIGDRVEMTFRRLYTAKGVNNYFWKARPAFDGTASANGDEAHGE